MITNRQFFLLCGGEVLVVAAGSLAAALVIQVIVLAAFLGDRRGYPAFAGGVLVFAAVLHAAGMIALLAVAGALGCGYLVLTLRDYRLVRRAAGGGA